MNSASSKYSWVTSVKACCFGSSGELARTSEPAGVPGCPLAEPSAEAPCGSVEELSAEAPCCPVEEPPGVPESFCPSSELPATVWSDWPAKASGSMPVLVWLSASRVPSFPVVLSAGFQGEPPWARPCISTEMLGWDQPPALYFS